MKELPSMAEMRRICRPMKHRKLFIEFYNPIFSIYFTWLFVRLGVSANAVTLLMTCLALSGGVLFAIDSHLCHILGGLVYLFAYFLDWVDGEVARYERWRAAGVVEEATSDPDRIVKGAVCTISATRGMFLDEVYHAVAVSGFLLGIGLSTYQHTGGFWYLVLGCAAACFFLLKRSADGFGYYAAWNYALYHAREPGADGRRSGDEAPRFVPWYASYTTAKNYVPLAVALLRLETPFVCAAGAAYFLLFWRALHALYYKDIPQRISGLLHDTRKDD
jgi:hypothetical protein